MHIISKIWKLCSCTACQAEYPCGWKAKDKSYMVIFMVNLSMITTELKHALCKRKNFVWIFRPLINQMGNNLIISIFLYLINMLSFHNTSVDTLQWQHLQSFSAFHCLLKRFNKQCNKNLLAKEKKQRHLRPKLIYTFSPDVWPVLMNELHNHTVSSFNDTSIGSLWTKSFFLVMSFPASNQLN